MKSFLSRLGIKLRRARGVQKVTSIEHVTCLRSPGDRLVKPEDVECDLQAHVFLSARETRAFAEGIIWNDRDDIDVVVETFDDRPNAVVFVVCRDSDDSGLQIWNRVFVTAPKEVTL